MHLHSKISSQPFHTIGTSGINISVKKLLALQHLTPFDVDFFPLNKGFYLSPGHFRKA